MRKMRNQAKKTEKNADKSKQERFRDLTNDNSAVNL